MELFTYNITHNIFSAVIKMTTHIKSIPVTYEYIQDDFMANKNVIPLFTDTDLIKINSAL